MGRAEAASRTETRTEDSWSGLEALTDDLRSCLVPRCRDASEVDDVVQETLIRVARYRSRLSEPEKLLPWSRRIAINVLCDRVRRDRRLDTGAAAEVGLEHAVAPADTEADEGAVEEVRCGSFVLEKEAALAVMHRELDGLRDEDRRLLWVHYGGNGSCRETARACAVPPALVKIRLFRARRRLLRAMRRHLALEAPPGCRPG